VPNDRAASLKAAESLLREGKLDQAISAYLQVIADQPSDWNTANLLGDLYIRAGESDKAIEQFVACADRLNEGRALPKAAALYKKILKLRPGHEHALLQCAEIAASQGVLVDARTYFRAVAEQRRERGDLRGLAQATIRLASLDPRDLVARLAGARARLELKDQEGAVQDLRAIAAEYGTGGQAAVQADAALRDSDDVDFAQPLFEAFLEAGDVESAREQARTPEQLELLAVRLAELGRPDVAPSFEEGRTTGVQADACTPAQAPTTVPASHGEAVDSAAPAVEDPADSDSWRVALEEHVRAECFGQALAMVRRLLERAPHRHLEVALAGLACCEVHPDVAFAMLDLAADAAVADRDWASAAAGFQELVTRVPMYLPALMRLVEVCVEGGLEATRASAQAQLADAYLEVGAAGEARPLAEDLVARAPWHRANIERVRRVLELLGEPDPDGLIAARLSGDQPFTSTDAEATPSSLVESTAVGEGVDAQAPSDATEPDRLVETATVTPVVESAAPASSMPPSSAALEGALGEFRHEAARRTALSVVSSCTRAGVSPSACRC
jgi:tetratricopeptide (TPR) repeat protein